MSYTCELDELAELDPVLTAVAGHAGSVPQGTYVIHAT